MKKLALLGLAFILSSSVSIHANEPHYISEFLTTFRSVKNRLDAIITEQGTVLFFYSDCCETCLKEVALVDLLAARFPELLFIKINMREYKDVAALYNITEPTFIFFMDGIEVDRCSSTDEEYDCDDCISYKASRILTIINALYGLNN